MLEYYPGPIAPAWAHHSSSFKNDDRCEPILYIVGTDGEKVYAETFARFDPDLDTDYDVAYSAEVDLHIGVVVRDV